MKQRLLLSLCAILCSVATWAVTFSSGQFKYSASGSTAEITGYNSSYSSSQLQNLVIPHTVTYNGTTYRVSKVGGLGASAYPKTVRVEYGEYDVTINKDAFKGCSNLTTVELTSCVYQILADAFKDCSKLKEVYVSKQSALLGSAAIFNSKVTVYIPYSADLNAHKASTIFNSSYVTLVQSIAPYDFKAEGCALLQNGNSTYNEVTVVFRIATTSTTWEIPASVAYGGQSWKVVSISPKANNVADSNLKTLIVRNPLNSIGVSAFQGNKNLTSVTVSGTVNLVDSYAFKNCSSLTTTQLAGIKQLGVEVFSGCTSLKTLNFGAASIGTLDNTALTGIPNLENIEINTTKYQSVNGWLYNYGKTTLLFCPPANTKNGWVKTVKNIAGGAFAGTKQTDVFIPFGVTTINQGTFEGSTALKRAVIPGSVTNWATTDAFKGCTALQYVICNMEKMPTAYATTFSNSNVKNAVLSVRNIRDDLTESYKNNTYWKQFKTIMGQAFDFQVGKIGYGVYYPTTSTSDDVYVAATTTATIPGTVTDDFGRTFKVTKIGPEAGKDQLTISGTLTAPNVTTVYRHAFQNCKNLTAVNLPAADWLGESAFEDCSSLTTVNLPLEMHSEGIGRACFRDCTSLTSFRWPLGVSKIEKYTFKNTGLTSFELPYGVVHVIEDQAFKDCKSLQKVVLPLEPWYQGGTSLSNVYDDVFENCSSLTDIICGRAPRLSYYDNGGVETGIFGSEGTVIVTLKSSNAYLRVPIADLSTAQNDKNTKKLFKSGHITMGGYDFLASNNLALKVLTLPSGNTPGTAIAVYKVPDGSETPNPVDLTKTYKDAWGREFRVVGLSDYCFAESKAHHFTLPSTVTTLPNHCFDGNRGLLSFNDIVSSGLTEIGDYALANCTLLDPKTLPTTVTKLGNSVFEGCPRMSEMTLPNTLTEMGDRVFANCQNMESVKLSYNLKRVGNETFSGCESLTGVKIPWGVTSLGYGLFSGCKKLIDVWIPSSVTSIAVDKKKDGMFWGCEKLSRVFMNIRTPLATSPDDKNFSPYRGDLLRVYVPKGSVKAYSTHDNYQKVLNLIKEGSYDVSRSGGYGVTECFDVKSWDAGMNRGEVIWANEICQSSNDEFAVDCSKRVTDDWDRQFVITEIGERAFDGSGSNTSQTGEHGYMTQLNLDDVKKIGASAFRGVSMPAGQPGMITIMGPSTRYLEIGEYAFADMRNVYLILIDGLADYNYRTNLKLGFGCFGNSYGNNAMTNVCVPKSDGKMFYDMMREWETKDQSSSNRRYTDQLGCIYHPGENLKDGVAIEEFPFAVSFEGLGLEAHILATKAPYLTDHIITAADKGWSVMLKSDKWSDSYLLLHPSKLPLIDGTVQKYEYINVNGATHLDDLSNGDVVYYYESYGDITGDGGQMKKLDNVNDIGKLPAGTIYVILPESVTHGAAVITPDVVVDGIAEVRAALNSDGRLYNLRGQRVDRPTKPGLYIVGGRKVIVK